MDLPQPVLRNRETSEGVVACWDTRSVHDLMVHLNENHTLRTTERTLVNSGLLPPTLKLDEIRDEQGRPPKALVVDAMETQARKKRWQTLIVQLRDVPDVGRVLFANDARTGRRWLYLPEPLDSDTLVAGFTALAGGRNTLFWPSGALVGQVREIVAEWSTHDLRIGEITLRLGTLAYQGELARRLAPAPMAVVHPVAREPALTGNKLIADLSHLDRLEAESIHIMREVAAQAENPVMLYSIGKDSSVMLHLARKAFYPSNPPFPLMHVDTRWKFQAMYEFRDRIVEEIGMDLIVHINPEGVEKDINPFDHGSVVHTDVMKTQGLRQALDKYRFDVAFGGARRDEEKSRAKERVFSFRNNAHRWDPKNQRPELWRLYNGYKAPGESIRVFPLSNWTELDIWQYIYREQIEIVPLYYAAERPVVETGGMLVMVDDDRMRLMPGEEIEIRRVRFRTLGCYPLTGAIESEADDLASIVLELLESRTSERQGRAIDSDTSASMEKKKQEGYF